MRNFSHVCSSLLRWETLLTDTFGYLRFDQSCEQKVSTDSFSTSLSSPECRVSAKTSGFGLSRWKMVSFVNWLSRFASLFNPSSRLESLRTEIDVFLLLVHSPTRSERPKLLKISYVSISSSSLHTFPSFVEYLPFPARLTLLTLFDPPRSLTRYNRPSQPLTSPPPPVTDPHPKVPAHPQVVGLEVINHASLHHSRYLYDLH